MNIFNLYLFDPDNRIINEKPRVVNGVSLNAIAPDVIRAMESFPLGTVSAVMVYNNNTEFLARYTPKDYLEKNIPKK